MNVVRSRRSHGLAVVLLVAASVLPVAVYAQHPSAAGHVGGHGSAGAPARAGGGHYAAPAGYGGRYYAGGPHPYSTGHGYVTRYGAASPHYAPRYAPPGTYPYAHPGTPYTNGYWYGGHGYWYGGHAWVGGYWNGGYWPHVWYYPGWSWYLPVLPFGYATFWWGGMPYYYWNSLYYTWSPAYNGYVVTDPPPVAGDADAAGSADGQYAQAAPQEASPAAAGAADVYIYPRSGQSDAQTQTDRYECHAWAVGQTGFDPTRANNPTGNATDYRRAMIACLDARGYSAR